jgi:hypothetical protein
MKNHLIFGVTLMLLIAVPQTQAQKKTSILKK